ncbi:protein VAPYRIN-like isoform X2 [Stegodyphus dumicola]|uniref:protein VAPYRIN-like isoform X2 n=1 Tax=Stegodyphus dumicola TaxID=202533 RepID=UPI0015B27464|nr:protein VAPYRIN-like isoform X2 [Stegodyphus dumicola]
MKRLSNFAIKNLVHAVIQAIEDRDPEDIKHILRRGTHTDYIFPSVTHDHVQLSAKDLFLEVNATLPEIIKMLIENSPAYVLHMRCKFRCAPLEYACRKNSSEVVQYLLSKGSSAVVEESHQDSPLLNALFNVAEYATPIATLLLDAGANINYTNSDRTTALMIALNVSASERRRAGNATTSQTYSFTDLCMLLIERGCDVNAVAKSSETALDIAIETKQEILIRKLLISRSDIDRRDMHGLTPLHYACLYGNKRLVDLLIISGARLRVQDWETNIECLGLLNKKNIHLLRYAAYESKQCLTLQNLCNITIRKNLRNVEEDANQLGLPPLLIKHVQLKD